MDIPIGIKATKNPLELLLWQSELVRVHRYSWLSGSSLSARRLRRREEIVRRSRVRFFGYFASDMDLCADSTRCLPSTRPFLLRLVKKAKKILIDLPSIRLQRSHNRRGKAGSKVLSVTLTGET